MTAIAVAFVAAAFMAAVAYAVPKLYHTFLQTQLIREQGDAEQSRFVALKQSHDMTVGIEPEKFNATDTPTPGHYI